MLGHIMLLTSDVSVLRERSGCLQYVFTCCDRERSIAARFVVATPSGTHLDASAHAKGDVLPTD